MSSSPIQSNSSSSSYSDHLRPDSIPHSADAPSYPRHKDNLPHLIDAPSSLLQEDAQPYQMAPFNRSGGRNVHIFDASNRSTLLGGLIIAAGITNANFYAMIEIFIFFNGDYVLRNEVGTTIEKDNSLLVPGNYYIDATCPFDVNNEAVLVRTMSSSKTGPRVNAFREAVRSRDRRCIVTGMLALRAEFGDWTGFEAAHIFPLAYEEHWESNNLHRWISIPPTAGGTINSIQNGILLDNSIHALFDTYHFSINPDDNYKIVHFGFDNRGIAGRYLDQRFIDNAQRPPDALFRWHFRQAVLANMRGAGEPMFEHDFPPGSDMMGEIMDGPKPGERMEFELFNRLAPEVDLAQ